MGITLTALFSTVIFIAYIFGVILIRNKRVIPESLLKTIFGLPECCRYVWAAIVAMIIYCMIPVFLATSESALCCVLIIIGCCGLVSGAASLIICGTEWNTWVFYKYATAMFCVCSQLLIAITMPVILTGWLLYVPCLVIKKMRSQKFFYLQILCFIMNFVLCLLFVL